MVRDDYLEDFNYVILCKLKKLTEDLHIVYEKLGEITHFIEKYKDYYIEHNIDISVIYSLNDIKEINIDNKNINKLDNYKITFIKVYNYIVGSRIKLLLKQIHLLNVFYNIPRCVFVEFQDNLNLEAIKFILKGNKYSFGSFLGSIFIKTIPQTKFKSLGINWGESNKLKKLLIESGESLYNKENNPNGKRWLVYYTDDYLHYFGWSKFTAKCSNKKYYRFKPIRYNFYNQIEAIKNWSDEKILDCDSMGGLNKLVALLRSYPEYSKKYLKNE